MPTITIDKNYTREEIFYADNDHAEYGLVVENDEIVVYNLYNNIVFLKYDVKKKETNILFTSLNGAGGMQLLSNIPEYWKMLTASINRKEDYDPHNYTGLHPVICYRSDYGDIEIYREHNNVILSYDVICVE